MTQTLKVTRKQAEQIIKATFPEYTGRKIKVEFTDKVTFWDTNWSGGSCNKYAALYADGRSVKVNAPAPWVNMIEGTSVTLGVNVLCVEHSYFCGQDAGITIYAHPANVPKWLEA
jgi:hypothetical protein